MLEEGIEINQKKPQLLTREIQEAAGMTVIVCNGTQCPIIYTKHVEKWNMPDPAMPLEEAKK